MSPLGPFDFTPLNRVIFAPGSLARLGELVRELGGSRVMLVTDPGLERSGHPQRAAQFIRDAGIEVFVFDDVRENPNTVHVDVGVDFAKRHQIDFLVAVGGGSSMDCAKGVNFIYTNGGRMIDYKGFGLAKKPMLPSIGVPTTSGTGSEAQCYALITDESSHMKMACGDKKAAFRVAILDPELTLSQPKGVAALTGIDAIAHAIESYVCTKATPISRVFSLQAWQQLSSSFEVIFRDPANMNARSAMQLGAHYAGVAIENAMLGIMHSCANPLTAHYGVTHGAAIGLFMPHVIRFNASHAESRYAELMSGGSAELAQRTSEFVKLTEQPQRLRDVGVSEGILPLLAHEASQQWTARFNPRPVTEEDLLQVYRMAW